jgi:ligand-binding SRPBCC domain-containing protein
MPTIHLTTFIAAPASVVFDLSRHVSVHKEAYTPNKIDAVAGTRFGLLEKSETITWKSYHLFKERLQRIKVVEMIKPEMYVEVQLQGDLVAFRHEHHFKPIDNGMLMIDLLTYEFPYGQLGKLFNAVYFNQYMESYLHQKINTIKNFAETERWKKLLIR